MKRRDFLRLAAWGTMGASWSTPLGATMRGSDAAEELAQEEPLLREISRLIQAKMTEYRIPGVAFGLSKNGTVAMRGFGVTSLERPLPVSSETVFPLASISKTVTATAMMRLHDRGLVDIEAPVRQYLPDFRIADEGSSQTVRIRHLLTHTPGWEGQLAVADHGPATLRDFMGTMQGIPALASPGEAWGYNNAGWAVAGRVIEAVTGTSIHESLDQLVFAPLGLEQAFTRIEEALKVQIAAPHQVIDGKTAVGPLGLPSNVPAGGCAMSLENLIRYARFHLGDGTAASGERLLMQESLNAMRTSRLPKSPSTDEMGLGWHLRTLDGVRTAQHGGTLPGYSLHLQLVPERDLCFAILANSGGTASNTGGWRLNEDVAAELLRMYEDLALARNQRTGGNRGGNERMNLHAQPLATQPLLGEFIGLYNRAPFGNITVRAEDGSLAIRAGQTQASAIFYAPDMAYSTGDGATAYVGMPIEFLRDANGQVRWIRVDGRIARKV